MKQRAMDSYPERDMTPEHTKRGNDHNADAPIHPDVDAAYDYVDAVIDTFDIDASGAPAWHGWALREAFLAGASYANGAQIHAEEMRQSMLSAADGAIVDAAVSAERTRCAQEIADWLNGQGQPGYATEVRCREW